MFNGINMLSIWSACISQWEACMTRERCDWLVLCQCGGTWRRWSQLTSAGAAWWVSWLSVLWDRAQSADVCHHDRVYRVPDYNSWQDTAQGRRLNTSWRLSQMSSVQRQTGRDVFHQVWSILLQTRLLPHVWTQMFSVSHCVHCQWYSQEPGPVSVSSSVFLL